MKEENRQKYIEAFFYAIQKRNKEIVNQFLDNGMDPNVRWRRKSAHYFISPLACAIRWRRFDIVQLLVGKLATKEPIVDNYAFHWAIVSGDINLIQKLVNCKIGQVDSVVCHGFYGETLSALQIARFMGNIPVATYLIRQGAPLLLSQQQERSERYYKQLQQWSEQLSWSELQPWRGWLPPSVFAPDINSDELMSRLVVAMPPSSNERLPQNPGWLKQMMDRVKKIVEITPYDDISCFRALFLSNMYLNTHLTQSMVQWKRKRISRGE